SADGAPESAHWRSSHACEPGGATGTGGENVAPPSVEVDTNISCCTPPVARLWNSRYTRLPGPTASQGRSWSASVAPRDCVQVAPPSSEYAIAKYRPAPSSSVATMRPLGVTAMSVSIVALVCPPKVAGVRFQVAPRSVEEKTTALPSDASLAIA